MVKRSELYTGMTVWTHRGQKLGQVVEVKEEELIVEKGFLWKKPYAVPMEAVHEVLGDQVYLNHGPDSLFLAPREISR